MSDNYDCIIVGGGFYGMVLATELKKRFSKVLVIEKESAIMTRASYNNQARIHMGYHYPRSLITAYRSHINFSRFTKEYEEAVVNNFDNFYAISKINSKISANQFYTKFKKMDIPIQVADKGTKELFNSRLIEEVFKVKEYCFDSTKLKEIIFNKFNDLDCDIIYNSSVNRIAKNLNNIKVILSDGRILKSKNVFNCTYSGTNLILKNSNLPLLDLKHELTEICLIDLPSKLKGKYVTIMDGPFFSILPFPSKNLSSISHVRYTPHEFWQDRIKLKDGYKKLIKYEKKSNFKYMINDACRYIPDIRKALYKESLFEVKTVQTKNENDDGRPILYNKDYHIKNFSNIMGGKIDNIYDIVESINLD
jgi:hypothetical protein